MYRISHTICSGKWFWNNSNVDLQNPLYILCTLKYHPYMGIIRKRRFQSSQLFTKSYMNAKLKLFISHHIQPWCDAMKWNVVFLLAKRFCFGYDYFTWIYFRETYLQVKRSTIREQSTPLCVHLSEVVRSWNVDDSISVFIWYVKVAYNNDELFSCWIEFIFLIRVDSISWSEIFMSLDSFIHCYRSWNKCRLFNSLLFNPNKNNFHRICALFLWHHLFKYPNILTLRWSGFVTHLTDSIRSNSISSPIRLFTLLRSFLCCFNIFRSKYLNRAFNGIFVYSASFLESGASIFIPSIFSRCATTLRPLDGLLKELIFFRAMRSISSFVRRK